MGDDSKTTADCVKNLVQDSKLFSVPLVSLLFTWFHVWLALQMMFYPINFWGLPRRPIVPKWLDLPINGWQGIIPRKAGVMAQRCCDKMIGNICTIEEFAGRIHPEHFWANCQNVFGDVCSEVLKKIITTRWPALWAALPPQVQQELTKEIERYMDEVMKIKDALSWRLQRIAPTKFEDIVHPIFKADEWILLAVGGFLGIVIGLLQAFALQHIGA